MHSPRINPFPPEMTTSLFELSRANVEYPSPSRPQKSQTIVATSNIAQSPKRSDTVMERYCVRR